MKFSFPQNQWSNSYLFFWPIQEGYSECVWTVLEIQNSTLIAFWALLFSKFHQSFVEWLFVAVKAPLASFSFQSVFGQPNHKIFQKKASKDLFGAGWMELESIWDYLGVESGRIWREGGVGEAGFLLGQNLKSCPHIDQISCKEIRKKCWILFKILWRMVYIQQYLKT